MPDVLLLSVFDYAISHVYDLVVLSLVNMQYRDLVVVWFSRVLTNNEDPRTMIRVIGKNFINSPIIPGQKAREMNAAKVVAVELIIGKATSPTPFLAACNGGNPSSINL